MGQLLIDVSNNNGHIDWDAAKASGVKGAFIKATEGNFFKDRFFPENWRRCKEVGLWRGAYHFARPSTGATAQEESYYFLDYVLANGLEVGDALVLDNEDEKFHGDVVPWAKFWFEIVESIVGFNALHYTGQWYIDSRMPNPTPLVPYHLWLAAYDSTKPNPPSPWTHYEFWQYTSNGTVGGVQGACDLNDFSGTDLLKYGKPATDEPPDCDANRELITLIRSRLSKLDEATLELGTGMADIQMNLNAVTRDYEMVAARLDEIKQLMKPS